MFIRIQDLFAFRVHRLLSHKPNCLCLVLHNESLFASTNGNEVLVLLVRWQRTVVDETADFVVSKRSSLGNHLGQSLQDRGDVKTASVGISHHTEEIDPLTEEHDCGCRDADQPDDISGLFFHQKRRVDVEVEEWRATEVIPATVVNSRFTSRGSPSFIVPHIFPT